MVRGVPARVPVGQESGVPWRGPPRPGLATERCLPVPERPNERA